MEQQHEHNNVPEKNQAPLLSDERINFSRLMLSGAFEFYCEEEGLVRELGGHHALHVDAVNRAFLDLIGTTTKDEHQIHACTMIGKTDWQEQRVVFLGEAKTNHGFILPSRFQWDAEQRPVEKQGKAIAVAGVSMPAHILTAEPAALVFSVRGEDPELVSLSPLVEAETYSEDIERLKAIASASQEAAITSIEKPSFLLTMALEKIHEDLKERGLVSLAISSLRVENVMSSSISLLCGDTEVSSSPTLLHTPQTESYSIKMSLSSEGLVSVEIEPTEG